VATLSDDIPVFLNTTDAGTHYDSTGASKAALGLKLNADSSLVGSGSGGGGGRMSIGL